MIMFMMTHFTTIFTLSSSESIYLRLKKLTGFVTRCMFVYGHYKTKMNLFIFTGTVKIPGAFYIPFV